MLFHFLFRQDPKQKKKKIYRRRRRGKEDIPILDVVFRHETDFDFIRFEIGGENIG